MAAYRAGRLPQAETQLRKILVTEPDHVEVSFLLGMVLGHSGRWNEAEGYLAKAVEAEPNRDQALYWLALAKKHLGQVSDAILLCQRAIAVAPQNPILFNELGLCHLTLNLPQEASKAFGQAVRNDPMSGAYQFNLGLAQIKLDRIYKARAAFEESIRLDPNRVESYLELARILEILGARTEAIVLLKKAVERHPADFQLLTALAAAHSFLGDRDRAEDIYRRAMSANPVSGHSLGLWLQQEGRFEESVDCLLNSIRAMPVQGVAYYGLTEAKVFEVDGVPLLDRAVPMLDSPDLDLKGKTYLAYAVAKSFERQNDPERTLRYYDLANECAYQLYNAGRPFDRQALAAITDQTISSHPLETVNQCVEGASESAQPIFIVGMIRSGTTLLDQILSSHPDVKSAGEPVYWMREADRVKRLAEKDLTPSLTQELAKNYLFAIRSVAGESPKISDKMPLNYSHIGLIHQVFPNAKIIHLRRNPLDTCLSIYTTFLGHGPNFAYNQSNIVFNYREYLRLMAHWRSVLPSERFTEVDYENLIDHRENITRQLISFCGLNWHDSCLHPEMNDSSIRTPSKWQARQPVYRSSVDRWKQYEPWLGKLLELRPK